MSNCCNVKMTIKPTPNGFNASHGLEKVMVGVLEVMAPILADNSSLSIDDDEGGSNYTVKDGKVDSGEDEPKTETIANA